MPGTPIFSKERHLLLIKCKVNIFNFIHKVQVGHRFSPRLCNRSPFYSLTSLGLKICLTIIIIYLLLFLNDCFIVNFNVYICNGTNFALYSL